MKLFGHHRHHDDSPWDTAPPWAIELRCMLGLILDNQEKIMSDTSRLDAALADLRAEVSAIGTQMDANFAALQAGHASGDQAAIDSATAAIEEQVSALKAIGARDTPAVA